jgi:chemotaxis protein MotA
MVDPQFAKGPGPFMFQIIGIVVLFATVFGSFIMTGGKIGVVLEAAPHELMAILGAGIAAFLISNSMTTIKATAGGMGKVFKGPKWKASDYKDLLSLLFLLTKTMKSKGVIALESHIEKPSDSTIFSRYPQLMKDHFAIDFVCDTLRMMTMNLEDPHQVEDAMEKQLEKHHHESQSPSHALSNMADALPALGIVAAVLGVIKTMGSITEPPEVLGTMIGSALVGTFLGVFLAYGIVGPMAVRMKDVIDEEGSLYRIIQSVLVAHLHGNAAQISVEIGRGSVPTPSQPSFLELEDALSTIPAEG